MDLKLSDSETQLRDGLRDFLAEQYDFSTHLVRTASGKSRDEPLWRSLIAGGWIAAALPDRDNIEQSVINASIVAEEFGRAVVVEPFFRSAFLAANIVFEACERERADSILEAIATGRIRYAAALYEPGGRFRPDIVETRAVREGDRWRLTGSKAAVMDGFDADRLIVSSRLEDGSLGLFEIAAPCDGLSRIDFRMIDDFAASDIILDKVGASFLGKDDGAIEAAIDRAIVALGAEASGACDAALDETARYAGVREQFGRAIAQFQVIAHRLARMFIELEGLRGGVIEGLANATSDREDRAMAASALKTLVADKGRFVVNQGIQVHGGVGTVEEYKVSHCFKRVFALETLYGNGDYHLDRYSRMME